METLQKDLDQVHAQHQVKTGPEVVDHGAEEQWTPASHQEHADHFRTHVLDNPKAKPERWANEATSGATPGKRVYKTPHPDPFSDTQTRRYLVRPYFDQPHEELADVLPHPIGGWAEMTNQALWHASGQGDRYQQVHVAHHRGQPVLVTHLDPDAYSVDDHGDTLSRGDPHHEEAEHARRAVLHDFLGSIWDRHSNNLLISHGKPLHIDAGVGFQYAHSMTGNGSPDQLRELRAMGHPPEELPPPHDTVDPYHHSSAIDKLHPWGSNTAVPFQERRKRAEAEYRPTLDWWRGVRDSVNMTMDRRLRLIRNPAVRDRIKRNWSARVQHLDDAAAGRAPLFGRRVPLHTEESDRDRAVALAHEMKTS